MKLPVSSGVNQLRIPQFAGATRFTFGAVIGPAGAGVWILISDRTQNPWWRRAGEFKRIDRNRFFYRNFRKSQFDICAQRKKWTNLAKRGKIIEILSKQDGDKKNSQNRTKNLDYFLFPQTNNIKSHKDTGLRNQTDQKGKKQTTITRSKTE